MRVFVRACVCCHDTGRGLSACPRLLRTQQVPIEGKPVRLFFRDKSSLEGVSDLLGSWLPLMHPVSCHVLVSALCIFVKGLYRTNQDFKYLRYP